MESRVYISEAKKELGYKDKRSFKRWCSNNAVGILSDIGSKRLYVIKEEFEEAKMRQAKIYLNQKYGDDRLFALNGHQTSARKYRPSGDNEKRFLNSLTKLITE